MPKPCICSDNDGEINDKYKKEKDGQKHQILPNVLSIFIRRSSIS